MDSGRDKKFKRRGLGRKNQHEEKKMCGGHVKVGFSVRKVISMANSAEWRT